MIRSHDEFEAALEEAARLLDASPADGAADHDRLLSLMREIARYRPTIQFAPAEETSGSERLSRRLDDFESRLTPSFTSHWQAMVGGDLFPGGDKPG